MESAVDPVVAWLLQGDPAIRWQVDRDLLDGSSSRVAGEQALVAREGWGAQLLDRRLPAGGWTGLYTPKWTSTTYTLLLLRTLGLPVKNRAAGVAARKLLDEGLGRDNGINFWQPRRKCSETCVTGMVIGIAARFVRSDDRVDKVAEYLLSEQMADGGWNCRRQQGATHSSLHTTILALECLLEYEERGGRLAPQTRAARARAHEFLFAHQLYRSHRTGNVIDERMTRFTFPPQWHYDVLRGLDYLAIAKAAPDERCRSAIDLVTKRRTPDGKWLLQSVHKGRYYFALERPGQASRWNTLRALRIMRWWSVEDLPATCTSNG